MSQFDPNAAATKDSGIFGLPFTAEESKLILIPVSWEATTSYGSGTAQGPQAILNASKQVDLYDRDLGNFFEVGITTLEHSLQIQEWNEKARVAALKIISGKIDESKENLDAMLATVNQYSEKLNNYIYHETKKWLTQNKLVGLIGGDHSIPFGSIQACLEKHPKMNILHIDAHADTRKAYEGFEYSHASIMYNVISKTPLEKLIQVGIRDFCEDEAKFIQNHSSRIHVFFDTYLAEQKMIGKNWSTLCNEIIQPLGSEIYISFDIDGLAPQFCPHTGTPVPGGLDFNEVLYLFKKIVQSKRKIIGFDLSEVSLGISAPHSTSITMDPATEWDANVAARLLYKLCGWALHSLSM
ncbi:MAG TPA: agmatinase family protein [Gammaproteobacteria bacterium]|nr:agmatinase family protein [Gammaproteobacteria bacterium]